MIALRPQLFLVYNADAGLLGAIAHTIHRFFLPSTYPCSLCALTHGHVAMRRDWKSFLNTLDVDVVFCHRDDFSDAYPHLGMGGDNEVNLPSVLFARVGAEPSVIVSAEEMNAMADVFELIDLVRDRVLRR
ncbi:MAG: hypothetical protein ABJP70_05645 [Erythrobacter sp.]